jgi:hypothetical protein
VRGGNRAFCTRDRQAPSLDVRRTRTPTPTPTRRKTRAPPLPIPDPIVKYSITYLVSTLSFIFFRRTTSLLVSNADPVPMTTMAPPRARTPPLLLLLPLLLPLVIASAAAATAADGSGSETQLFTHEFTLPQDNVARGIAYRGDGRRVRSVLRSLKHGRAVHLGVIGGSITWGHGALHCQASERACVPWSSRGLIAEERAASVAAAAAAKRRRRAAVVGCRRAERARVPFVLRDQNVPPAQNVNTSTPPTST